VLVHFPFTDLQAQKLRPAVVLAPSGSQDVVVAFVTSRLALTADPAAFVIAEPDPEFAGACLRVPSAVRPDKLATLERSLVVRRLRRLGPNGWTAVNRALRVVFGL
jgi:mRNA interferase MazF